VWSRKRLFAFVIVPVVLLLIGTMEAGADEVVSPRAGPLIGGNFEIGGGPYGFEEFPDVAYNATNRQYLVVWTDTRNEWERGWDIVGKRLRANGTTLGTEFLISGDDATGNELAPAIVWNAIANQYFVVYSDCRDGVGQCHVYGRRVRANGKPVGRDVRLSSANSATGAVAVAWNATDNQYLVVWDDQRNLATRSWDIYGKRVSAVGKPIGRDFRISGPKATSQSSHPQVAFRPSFTLGCSEYFIVWYDTRNDQGDVYGRRVSAAGTTLGGDFHVSRDHEWGAWQPDVAYSQAADRFLVVWADNRNPDWWGTGLDIYGRLVVGGGKPTGSDFRISGPGAIDRQLGAAVTWSNAKRDRFLVVWQDWRQQPTQGWDIWAQRVKANGTLFGSEFLVGGPGDSSEQQEPAVAWNGTREQHLVVWQDDRDPFSFFNTYIWGQRVAG